MKKILLTLLALTLSLTVLAGCTVSSIDDEIHENTEKDVIEETSGENTENKNNGVPQGITVNKIEFNTITEMSDLPESVLNAIDAGKEKRGYTPHLTIVKKRPGRTIDMERVKKRAEIKLIPATEYTLKSITIFYQPKEHSIYIPYMEIPFGHGDR